MFDDALRPDHVAQSIPIQGLSTILRYKSEIAGPKSFQTNGAFGYLEGQRDQATALQFRFRNGNSVWFTYHWLGTWQFDPSEGLLLKFSGDLIYLVLIRGSNLDRTVKEAAVSLTQGLQERRVTWVREMSEQEAECVGEDGPTIDQIQWGQFDSQEAVINWLSKTAPAFVP